MLIGDYIELSPSSRVPTAELPEQLRDETSHLFDIFSKKAGHPLAAADGTLLGSAAIIGKKEYVRAMLWPATDAESTLEQVEEAVALLLRVAFSNDATVGVVVYLDPIQAHYTWPLMRLGFGTAEDLEAEDEGIATLMMRRHLFKSMHPWGGPKESPC